MEVSPLVRRARGSDDWHTEAEQLAEAIRREPGAALTIGRALDEDLSKHGWDLAITALRERAFDLACVSPAAESTKIAIALGAQAPMRHPADSEPDWSRMLNAMQIAGTRPSAEIEQVLSANENLRSNDPEFGLLLTHELVLRGAELSPGVGWFAEWAMTTDHRLARLPLRLLDIECEMTSGLPDYSGLPHFTSPPSTSEGSAQYVQLGDLLSGIGPEIPLREDEVVTPFQDWLDLSFGRVRVAAYRPGDSYPPGLPEPRIRAARPAAQVPPTWALRELFIAACNGGAYSRGFAGAMARLHVWTSLTALMDLPAGSPIDQVAEAAGDARWMRLALDRRWFNDVGCDVWMIVDDGRRVTSIAATDTD